MSTNTTSPNVKYARLSALILFSIWGYSFLPAIKSVLAIYYQSSYDHYGFISLILVGGLFWVTRHLVANFDPSPNIYGLVAIIVISSASAIAFYNKWLLIQNVLFIGLLPLIIFATCGIRITLALIFPISCMILLIPIGYLIVPSILDVILKILHVYLKLLGFGWYLTDQNELDSIKKLFFAVNYLIAWLVFIASFSYFKISNIVNKILFTVSGVCLPMIINLLVAMLVVSMQMLGLRLPSFLYPVISIVACISGLVICILVCEHLKLITTFQFAMPNVARGSHSETVFWDPNASWSKLTVIAGFALIIPGWVVSNFLDNPWIEDYKLNISLRAPSIYEWNGPDEVPSKAHWQPKFFGNSTQILAAYNAKQKEVWLYSAYYYKIFQTGGLIDANNKLYDDTLWDLTQSAGVRIHLFKNKSELLANEILLSKGDRKQVIWYWYYVGSIVSHDQDLIYMLNGVKTVASMRDDAGIIAVATEFESTTNIEEVRSRLIYFINSLDPHLEKIMHPEKSSSRK